MNDNATNDSRKSGDTERLMLKGGEIEDQPGWWAIHATIEGKEGEFFVVRKQDGTYWEVAAEHLFPRSGGTYRGNTGTDGTDPNCCGQKSGDTSVCPRISRTASNGRSTISDLSRAYEKQLRCSLLERWASAPASPGPTGVVT